MKNEYLVTGVGLALGFMLCHDVIGSIDIGYATAVLVHLAIIFACLNILAVHFLVSRKIIVVASKRETAQQSPQLNQMNDDFGYWLDGFLQERQKAMGGMS